MSSIHLNYPEQQINPVNSIQNQNIQFRGYAQHSYLNSPKTLRDEFITQHKKNGLFEKLYNGLKNLTHLGMGSKKAEALVSKAENGEISEEEARAGITKYRNSQATSAQIFGDAASIGIAATTFFKLKKGLKMAAAKNELNKNSMTKEALQEFGGKMGEKLMTSMKSNKKLIGFAAISAALWAGITKKFILRVNRIGSDEFKVNKQDYNNLATEEDEIAYKLAKKGKKQAKRKANRHNFWSGAINGLMMPITAVGGAIAGVPLYVAGNSLNRYFVGNTTERKKTFGGYFDNLKNDAVLHAGLAAGMAIPLFKKGKWSAVFDKNLSASVKKLKDATLSKPFAGNKSAYNELDEILMGDKSIQSIINSGKDVESQIDTLLKENIFAVKFKQISNDGTALCETLKENCPPSRTIEDAKRLISKTFGDKYEVKQLVGVGTVAETYLAKGKDGKDVCIKLIKDGVTKEKILADKNKFEKIIEQSCKDSDKQGYLKRNLQDLYEGIVKEVDLESEKVGAEKLAKYTTAAKVVKPIEVMDNIYVMEKADGISLKSLINLNTATSFKSAAEKGVPIKDMISNLDKEDPIRKMLKDAKTNKEAVDILQKYIEKVQSRTPQYGDIKLSKEDVKALIEEYQQVLVEQFNKVDKNGKILHADIHTGNIFIDINALKARKSNAFSDATTMLTGKRKNNQIFTLIDTGNMIELGQEQAMRSINLSSYIQHANVPDITDYVLDGAILPKGMTKEKATELISSKLKEVFFDTKTSCETVTNESLVNLTTNIMREHGIIPADTALNLNKARQSANNSLGGLYDSITTLYMSDLYSNLVNVNDMGGLFKKVAATVAEIAKDLSVLHKKNTAMQSAQEKMNLKHLPLDKQIKYKKNPNNLATNSEDLLTYKLKQSIRNSMNIPDIK